MTELAPEEIEQLDVWSLPADDIDRMLATRDDPRLRTVFGADYEQLRLLARQAAGTVRGRKTTVLFLPGILGSTLGVPGNFITRDTIWLDPVSISKGKITDLKLSGTVGKIKALGVVPVVHAFLRLRLKISGFDVEYYPYDWRQSLLKTGKELSDFIKAHTSDEIMIVAHSMGGLVARAALHIGAKKVKKFVMVGTPNQGSFASVEVLQGINGNVQMVDKMDLIHEATQLAEDVFSTFPSIYELMPRPEVYDRIDLFKSANWPAKPFRPDGGRLTAAKKTWEKLADADERFHLIAGYNQRTVTDLAINANGQFEYGPSNRGDGTVPLRLCEMDGVPTRYTEATHTGLLRSEGVARAVADLLKTGKTNELSSKPEERRSGDTEFLTAADFRDDSVQDLFNGRRGRAITETETAQILEAMIAMSTLPPQQAELQERSEQAAAPTKPSGVEGGSRLTSDITFNKTIISRDRQCHLDVELYNGSLFDAPYRAIVLGIFNNVDPAGPAAILNSITGGAVQEMLDRRMFHTDVGKVFVMPTGRNSLKADYIVFVGLGDYSDFLNNAPTVLRIVSCNLLRTLMHCGVDEFATVVYGGSSGLPMRYAVESFIRGYLDALESIRLQDQSITFRRLALCEYDPSRYAELKDELYRIGGTSLCDDVCLRLSEPNYPKSPATQAISRAATPMDSVSVTYLTIQIEEATDNDNNWTVRASLLTTGGKATVFPSAVHIDRKALEKLIDKVPKCARSQLANVGQQIMTLVFSNDFRSILEQNTIQDTHLAIIHNGLSSRVPWEALPLQGNDFPCIEQGISRRYQTDGTNSISKFLMERQCSEMLRVLLIIDPTEDLPGALKEGKQVKDILNGVSRISVEVLEQQQATRSAILKHLGSGEFDVVHYAGHAFFDPENRSRSGLICANDEVLRGRHLEMLDKLPSLVFFNACESGRVRRRFATASTAKKPTTKKPTTDDLEQNIGVAEALLRGGIAQFVGTYWPVGDEPAKLFADEFYRELVSGSPVRIAVLNGRKKVFDAGSIDFADYVHYGSPTFAVKLRNE